MLFRSLHLTPEQEVAVKAAMENETKLGQEMMAKFGSGKMDPHNPQNMADLKAMTEGNKSVDQTLKDILTPDQKTEYQQMQTEQKNSAQESMATSQTSQLAPLLQLSDSQKDQVYSALYQANLDTQSPDWIKAHVNVADPGSILDAQAKAKEDALSKVLTPSQLATYHQQAQSQLELQKSMMQKFTPPAAGAPVAVPPGQ